jgi:hypothetical protein
VSIIRPLAVHLDTIPRELREQPWVLWRAEPRGDDKPAKVPYRVSAPLTRASSTDPDSWSTFDDAAEAYSALADRPADPDRGPIAGIGVVLTQAAGITCLDLDRVIAPDGQLHTHAATIVDRCASWTEISPSGTGLHVFVKGAVSEALKGPQIEVYSTARYIAVTGRQWPGTPATLTPQQAYLDHLVRLGRAETPARPPYNGPKTPAPDDLAGALLAKLEAWGVEVQRIKRWSDGYLVELVACPWAAEHTTGPGGAAVAIHASGAFDFICLHAHCGRRDWRDFRAAMERGR